MPSEAESCATLWVKSSERLCNFFFFENFSLQLGHDLAGRPRPDVLSLRYAASRRNFSSSCGALSLNSATPKGNQEIQFSAFLVQIKTTSLANGMSLAGVVSLVLSCFEG